VNEGSADDENLVQIDSQLTGNDSKFIQFDYENDMNR